MDGCRDVGRWLHVPASCAVSETATTLPQHNVPRASVGSECVRRRRETGDVDTHTRFVRLFTSSNSNTRFSYTSINIHWCVSWCRRVNNYRHLVGRIPWYCPCLLH